MSNFFPTYAFEGDNVAAFDGDQVIARGDDFAKVAAIADEHFAGLNTQHEARTEEEMRSTATHITTPNGETGTILGRTSSLFADNITVRFDNGQIRHYDTFVGDGLKFSKVAADTPSSPIEYFQRQLDEAVEPSKRGLTARLTALETIRKGASSLASQGVSYADGQALHQIVLTADAETNEVTEALDHLIAVDAEAMAPPKQSYTAVEQAHMGRSDDWLEVVANEMVEESEAEDFDRLAAEGPTKWVGELETATLAHQGTVADMAREFIQAKTAGFQGEKVDEYRDQWMANAEQARRREAAYRKDAAAETMHKEAAVGDDVPDDALFL